MQHTFNLHKNSIRISVTHEGKQYRKSTGLTTKPALWDAKAKKLRARCKDYRVLDDLLEIHARLTEKEVSVRTEEDVLAALDYALTGKETAKESKSGPTFWEYFDEWGSRPSSSQRQRALAVRVVAKLMGRKEDWDGIDSAYWFRLQRKMEDAGYSVNYRWNIGARLKVAMHEGFKLKYHSNQDFREFSSKKEQAETIALTPDEIEMLWEYVPTSEMLGKVRDLALIGYYSAARFSDYSRISTENVHDGKLEFVQKKTGDKVILPVAPRLVVLLERNGGKAPAVNQVVFNRYVKRVAREAGIDGVVSLPPSRRKADGSPTYRWEMVQSHTFRRSALTALYLSGVSVKDCMFASGHKSISAFERYLRISKEQAVDRLAGAELFR